MEFSGINPVRQVEREDNGSIVGREGDMVPWEIDFFGYQESEHFGKAKAIKKEEFELLWQKSTKQTRD